MKFLTRIFLAMICVAFHAIPNVASAEGIKVRQVQIEPAESGLLVNASFQIELPPELGDAVKKGIPFHFLAELNITRGRWSYQPLTQQYRVSGGGLTLSAATLNEALIQLGSIGAWQVADSNTLEPGKQYQAEIRLRLDLAQLPKPFQINALNAREWNLSSDWQRFAFVLTTKNTSAK